MLSPIRRSVCRLSVCLSSVTLVRPTQPVEIFGNLFRHTVCSFLMPIIVGGDTPFPLKFGLKVTHPLRAQRLRPISAHSASSVIASEKKFK